MGPGRRRSRVGRARGPLSAPVSSLGSAVLMVVGTACVVVGTLALRRRSRDRRLGELVAADAGRPVTLRSRRYRLLGRPDAIRRRSDGALVPIELKHRPLPRRGPFPSHLIQLAAYCLLIEEVSGRVPPFGVLRYVDGEVLVPFDEELRAKLITVLVEVAGPYDGRADPGVSKCARCPWSPSCDASMANPHRPALARGG